MVTITHSTKDQSCVPMCEMKPGDYGIVSGKSQGASYTDYIVYHDGIKIIMLNRPDRWTNPDLIKYIYVRILQPGESVTIHIEN